MSAAMKEMLGETLLGKDGEVPTSEALAGKTEVWLYFSAHWCPPCRGFTEQLVPKYHQLIEAGKPVEIIFVSSDRDEAAFNEYFAQHPWLALPCKERAKKQELCAKFGVTGIPMLLLLDAEGNLYNRNGRGAVMNPVDQYPYK